LHARFSADFVGATMDLESLPFAAVHESLLARNGHADRIARRPLSGAKRKTFAHSEFFSV
jgi:hypothetical protein